MKHPIDAAVIFGALWLLAAMLIDALTPRELSVYMIGVAPALGIGALFYHLRLPPADLAITLATLWLAGVIALEWITPKPLSPYFATVAIIPSILVGAWLHGTAIWRRMVRSNLKTAILAVLPERDRW